MTPYGQNPLQQQLGFNQSIPNTAAGGQHYTPTGHLPNTAQHYIPQSAAPAVVQSLYTPTPPYTGHQQPVQQYGYDTAPVVPQVQQPFGYQAPVQHQAPPEQQGFMTPAQGMFGDLMGSRAYTPTAAPKREREQNFNRVTRQTFQAGYVYDIRPLSHPKLLPRGFHFYTMHVLERVPGALGKNVSQEEREAGTTRMLCTESYAPDRPCYTCSLIQYLDQNGYLNVQTLGERLCTALVHMSVAYSRSVIIPMLIRGRMAQQQDKKNPSKMWDVIWPDATQPKLLDVTLWLKPANPEKGSADKSFMDKLSILGMDDSQIQTQLWMLQQQAQQTGDTNMLRKFESAISGKHRNPRFHDPQHGQWIKYDKQAKSQDLTLSPEGPSALPLDVMMHFLDEDRYPDISSWGQKSSDYKESAALTWFEQCAAFTHCHIGQQLIQILGGDLDLDPADFAPVPF